MCEVMTLEGLKRWLPQAWQQYILQMRGETSVRSSEEQQEARQRMRYGANERTLVLRFEG
eukprot:CAMPEP_0169481336 /NCGR_PEP_ID=MMETSP1042-20121227/30058_1 /TAXON_ID=464988 /ORGANISM="Hemiselmis andersenii, Strain CCMP1180" /LENGTH=59 /DNA_ID=CAMNT_0009596071 /DNA_START=40 /DNA_END=216 /DNA_ORIENTATION=+